MTDKAEKRKICISERNSISAELREKLSIRICDNILSLNAYKDYEIIYGYYPVRGEVDILPLLEKALEMKKTVALPRCIDRNGHMVFHRISSLSELVKGYYGIYEPDENNPIEEGNGIILVPGVAFDSTGHRMGYGGGYYDRYLAKYPKLYRVGICFSRQLTELTADELDQGMDAIINEENIKEFVR